MKKTKIYFEPPKREVQISISMKRHICCLITFIWIVGGMTSLLLSCSTEIAMPDKRSKGPKVAINFALQIGSQGNNEVVVRSGLSANEPVTAFARVAGDVYMYATLEPESPVTTRAAISTTTLPDNYWVRIVAYETGGTIAAQEDYEVIAGLLIGNEFLVADDETYTFVAYSFNTNTLPVQNASNEVTFSVSSYTDLDLLWGSIGPVLVKGDGTTSLTIEVGHLFSRIMVEASSASIISNPAIDKIIGVTVSPHYNGPNTVLNAVTGNLTVQGNPSGLPITRWRDQDTGTYGTAWRDGGVTPAGELLSTDIESDYFYLFKHESDTFAIKINNLIVDGVDLGRREFRFSSVNLEPGKSYVLKMNFKKLVWAGSNIIWDNSRLTFLPETTPDFMQGYQGVFFFWGSLIGISPVGTVATGSPGNFSTTNNSGTQLYVPPSIAKTSPTIPARANWTTAYAGSTNNSNLKPWTGLTMADIPRVPSGANLYSPSWLDDHSSRNYLYEVHDTINFRGDICRYLTERQFAPPGNWRMPNSKELGYYTTEYGTTALASGFPSTIQTGGMHDFYNDYPSYATKLISSTTFPAGGSRDASGAFLTETRYLSGSPANNAGNPSILNACFSLQIVAPSTITYNLAPIGVSTGIQGVVRCIKLEESGLLRTFLDLYMTGDIQDWENGGTYGAGSDTQGEIWF